MKRQEPPTKCESVGAPSSAAAVVCVVPPARRSPCAEPAGSGPTPLRHAPSGPLRHPLPAAAPTPAVQPRLTAAAGAPPHLLTALAQAAAGPQPAAAGPLSYARAAPSHAAVYGENLTVRRDSSSPFQPATVPPQGVGVATLSSGSVQTLSSTPAPQLPHMAHQTSVRRQQQQPTGVLTQSMVGSSASAAVGPGSKPPSMPAAAAASAAAPPESTHPPSYHRLKVEDALSYLDQVKSKFQNNPEVYNDFLDIMKEFKAQNIDTPGVITRVSSLFRGHPALIVGFNTFLPPGYKIEVQSSNDYLHVSMTAPGQVTTVVHTPTGGLQTYHDQTDVAHHHPTAMMISKQVPHPPPSQQQQTQPSSVAPLSQQFRGPYGTNNIVSGPLGGGQHGASGHHTYTQQLQQGSGVATSSSLPVQLPAQQQPAAASSQPVEFNHAINYVNKIKNRFQGQPEVYKQFLEILHTYQKEQRCLKEGVAASGPVLSETEVYAKVAALFQSHEDLMDEFGQFLPDATNGNAVSAVNNSRSVTQEHVSVRPASGSTATAAVASVVVDKPVKPTFQPVSKPLKRSIPTPPAASPVAASSPSAAAAAALPAKKPRIGVIRDVTLAEAAKYGTLNDFAFFDQVRKTLRNQDVYNNFLRVLSLYNTEIISRSDVIQLVTPFIGRKPGLLKWLKDFMGVKDGRELVEPIALGMSKPERAPGDQTVEIDPSTCKRLGASYCALPKSYPQPRCTGRNQLCREVLNDTWVSFPSYSEDSTFVTSRKTQYEEYIYRCEDERFELDMVLEINLATIRILEGVQKKLSRMAPEDAARHRLDDCLGGTSPTVHQRAVRRIYGEKGGDIIDGLKKNPIVAVPVVLRRLKAKQDEWREAQKGYNKIWREQNEKYYLKSLDPQGINFKQTDVKMLRSKALLNELYTLFDERHEQLDEGGGDGTAAVPTSGPHMQLVYANRRVLPDAASLIIHHVKRQTSIQNEDKAQMKQLLRHTLVGMLHARRQRRRSDSSDDDEELAAASDEDSDPTPPSYTLFMASSNWYLFLRLHQLLCERLDRIYQRAVDLARAEQTYKKLRSESAAIALRLKPKNEVEVEDYYPAFLDLVKSVLDNNMDSSQYEDTLREMFGTHAYHAFTADKIVSGAVRQLQHIVTENVAQLTLKEYQSALEGGGAGGPCSTAEQRQPAETAYVKRVEQLLTDENEHCMKIYLFSDDGRMTIELLDTTDSEDSEDGFAEEKRRSSYQEKYASPSHQTDDELRSAAASAVCLPLFLARNLRRRGVRRHQQQLPQDSDVIKQEAGGTAADRPRRDDVSAAVDGAAADIKQEPLQISGEEQFKLGADYRFLPVVKTGSYLHRRNCLTGARARHGAVSTRLNVRFRSWHAGWLERHVCARQLQLCADWLMGRLEDTKPCRTFVLTDNDLDRPPYSQYNRYRVEWLSDHS